MLIGYVSDERYLALSGVALEFVDGGGRSWEARSRATGAVHADLPAGSLFRHLAAPRLRREAQRGHRTRPVRRYSSDCSRTG